ncbi:MAG: hypothetical protein M0T77_03045 [Actinomycetota bacterium]|nr:hypothetical protein [Actinomycetota bacterium]
MAAFAVQISAGHHTAVANILTPLLVLVVAAIFGRGLIWVLQHAVVPARRRLQTRRSAQRALSAAASTELRTRAMMDELCPRGWRAQIVLFSSADQLPSDTPEPSHKRVVLEWAELVEPVTVRRVWAASLNEALEAMVADRITDETLQRIEHEALSEGVSWPDP